MNPTQPIGDEFATTPGALPLGAETPFGASDRAQESRDDGPPLAGAQTEISEQLTAMIDTAVQRGDALMLECRNQVRAHPISTVALAFVAGMLFDRLSRGRR